MYKILYLQKNAFHNIKQHAVTFFLCIKCESAIVISKQMMKLGHQTSTQRSLLSLLRDSRDIYHHVNFSLLTKRMEHMKKI